MVGFKKKKKITPRQVQERKPSDFSISSFGRIYACSEITSVTVCKQIQIVIKISSQYWIESPTDVNKPEIPTTALYVRLVYGRGIYAQRDYYCFAETFFYKSLTGERLKKIEQESQKLISASQVILVEIHTILTSIAFLFKSTYFSAVRGLCELPAGPHGRMFSWRVSLEGTPLHYSWFRGVDCFVQPCQGWPAGLAPYRHRCSPFFSVEECYRLHLHFSSIFFAFFLFLCL